MTAATLVTYPYLCATLGCLTYLALIPVSMRRYRELVAQYGVTVTPALPTEARMYEKQ
ncbi:MAG: hypothetical protein HC850_16690 [Rhodomicrobium sp.]|nr:hypothetical protein [Rhodomicrobium sp.]